MISFQIGKTQTFPEQQLQWLYTAETFKLIWLLKIAVSSAERIREENVTKSQIRNRRHSARIVPIPCAKLGFLMNCNNEKNNAF